MIQTFWEENKKKQKHIGYMFNTVYKVMKYEMPSTDYPLLMDLWV